MGEQETRIEWGKVRDLTMIGENGEGTDSRKTA